MNKVLIGMVSAGMTACAGCLSSATTFVASSAPAEQGKYTEIASEVSGTCKQVQWLFFTFGKSGSPQRHALEDALLQAANSDALVSMAVDTEQFALISTTLMPIAVFPVITRIRVTGTPIKFNAQ